MAHERSEAVRLAARGWWAEAAMGAAFAAGAVAVRAALDPLVGSRLIYGPTMIAVAVVAAWRGWRAAVVCLLIATPLVTFLFLRDASGWRMSGDDRVALVSFLIIAGSILVVADLSHRALGRARAEAAAAKRADEAQRESEERYRRLVELSPDAIIVTVERRVVYANAAAGRLFGVEPAALLGLDVRTMVHEESRTALEAWIGELLTTGKAMGPTEQRWVRPGGGVLTCEAVAAPMLWKGAPGIQRILRDVGARHASEQKLAAQARELARSNADLEDFAYVVSHDLKEPLRGIANFAEFLREDAGHRLTGADREKLDTLVRLSVRMHQLLDSLLEYSRAGRSEMAVTECDLAEVAVKARETLAPWLAERNAEVVIGEMPRARCDALRVQHVFSNLLTNAVKYNDSGSPRVEIGGTHNGAGVAEVYVRDNGIGIAERHHRTVFKMFRRLHPRDRYGGGTGSGLAIVKTIVERHGGRIWVESEPGRGSTFRFTLSGQGATPPPEGETLWMSAGT